jgi:hypothetical protein
MGRRPDGRRPPPPALFLHANEIALDATKHAVVIQTLDVWLDQVEARPVVDGDVRRLGIDDLIGGLVRRLPLGDVVLLQTLVDESVELGVLQCA